jgi:lysophospholipase L1-like esterase
MRLTLTLLLLAAAAAVAFLAVGRDDEYAAVSDTGALTLVGDSLNVGTAPYLQEALPHWHIDAHDRVGRSTEEGLAVLRDQRRALAPVVVVSLGTNDAEGTEGRFRELVDEAVALVGPSRCLVWATIVRGGAEREGFDDVLRDAADAHANVRLVDWAALVSGDEELLTGDLVHGTPAGYARRADATVDALGTCPDRGAA